MIHKEDFSRERYQRILGSQEISNLMVAMGKFTGAAIIPRVIAVLTRGEHAKMAAKSYSRRIKWNCEFSLFHEDNCEMVKSIMFVIVVVVVAVLVIDVPPVVVACCRWICM